MLEPPFLIFEFPKRYFLVKVITPPDPDDWSDPLRGSYNEKFKKWIQIIVFSVFPHIKKNGAG